MENKNSGKHQPFEWDPTEKKAFMLNIYAQQCHEANKLWWTNLETNEYPQKRNIGEMLMLCVSELAEAMEGHRKNLQDDKLPHRKMFDVELVDCFIRLFDLAGALKIDLDTIFVEKMDFNRTRSDHTKEARLAEGGKKY